MYHGLMINLILHQAGISSPRFKLYIHSQLLVFQAPPVKSDTFTGLDPLATDQSRTSTL